MPFSLFGFFHRWTGVFLPRSGDNAETLGKYRNPVCLPVGWPGKIPETSGKMCINLKLSGNPLGICKYAQEYTKTGR